MALDKIVEFIAELERTLGPDGYVEWSRECAQCLVALDAEDSHCPKHPQANILHVITFITTVEGGQ